MVLDLLLLLMAIYKAMDNREGLSSITNSTQILDQLAEIYTEQHCS